MTTDNGARALAERLRAQSPWKDDDAFLDVWANEAAAILANGAPSSPKGAPGPRRTGIARSARDGE